MGALLLTFSTHGVNIRSDTIWNEHRERFDKSRMT
jgi:hypothetical protein